MKWLQAADAQGGIHIGYLDQTHAYILRVPHKGIATSTLR